MRNRLRIPTAWTFIFRVWNAFQQGELTREYRPLRAETLNARWRSIPAMSTSLPGVGRADREVGVQPFCRTIDLRGSHSPKRRYKVPSLRLNDARAHEIWALP